MDDKKPAPEVKPDSVKITSFKFTALPGPMGRPVLLVLGIGDDDVVYNWDGTNKRWQVQK